MFWMLKVVAVPFGGAPWAVRIGGAVYGGLAFLWLVWAVSARGVRLVLAAGTVTALTFLGVSAEVLRLPWNVYFPLPFFVLFVFLAHLTATGSPRQLIAMTIAATIIVQTHVGFSPLVLAGFAWALACIAFDRRQQGSWPDRWRTTVGISAAIWIVTWIVPMLGVAVGTPGNFRVLVQYFSTGGHPSVGFSDAVGIFADEFRPVPQWLGGHQRTMFITGNAVVSNAAFLLIPVVLLAIGYAAARFSRSRDDARMVGLAITLFVVGLVAISRADEPRAYTFQWRVVVAAFIVVASLWSVANALVPVPGRVLRTVAAVAMILVIAWGCSVRAWSERTPGHDALEIRDSALTEAMHQVDARAITATQKVLVRSYGSALPHLFDGIVNALAKRGVDVRVDPARARAFGSQRTATEEDVDEVWYVTEQGSLIPDLLAVPGARTIASTSPFPSAVDAELAQMQRQLGAQLGATTRPGLRADVDSPLIALIASNLSVDHALADKVARMNAEVAQRDACRCAIVVVRGPGRFVVPSPK
jgi:hypothetical protein